MDIDSSNLYRKGGPGLLPRQPVDDIITVDDALHPHSQSLIDYATQLCSSNQIPFQITILTRYNRGSRPRIPADHTLLIVADRSTNQDDIWILIIKSIISRFNTTSLSFGGRVEICDPLAYYGQRVYSIPHDHELVHCWYSLQARLLSALEGAGAGAGWATIVPLYSDTRKPARSQLWS